MGVCTECNTYVPDTKGFCGNCGTTYKGEARAVYAGAGDEVCPACNKSVSITLRIKAEGHPYHLACFECSRCSRPVYATQKDALQSGGYEMKQGSVWCKRCVTADAQAKAEKTIIPLAVANSKPAAYSGDGICTECGKAVSPTMRVFGPDDNLYHLACLECCKCARPVFATVRDSISPGGYEVRQGKTWCRKCVDYEKKEQTKKQVDIRWDASAVSALKGNECGRCGKALSGSSSTRPSGATWCMACVNEEDAYQRTASSNTASSAPKANRPKCAGCGRDVYEGGSKQVGAEVYHSGCAPALDPCGGCNQHVSGRCILAPDGKKWHEACFVCSRCGGSMLQGHGVVNGKLQCATCVQTPQAKSPPASSGAGLKFCQQCGAKLEGRKFCTGCGTPV